MEFLDFKKFRFDWDNDELEETEQLVERENPEFPAELPGIPLESESGVAGIEAILPPSTEQQAYKALVNA